MEFIETHIKGVYLIKPRILQDERGLFFRTFCKKEFAEIGFMDDFVQFNHSFNLKKGTIRGMHFQQSPYSEAKLIRCIQGKIKDIAVDIRRDSPTYLQHVSVELSAENNYSILIPPGCAHGFQTLEDHTGLMYHHTQYYTPEADAGIRYNDPTLKIEWELPPVNVSEKDKSYSLIEDLFLKT
jgi:dTDP-4-dehydrorhamnose 3,5-epimerase